jgi:hypothetical protein
MNEIIFLLVDKVSVPSLVAVPERATAFVPVLGSIIEFTYVPVEVNWSIANVFPVLANVEVLSPTLKTAILLAVNCAFAPRVKAMSDRV